MKTIAQGAEATITLDKNISKDRIPKTYRYPTLDTKIRTRRTKSEAKLLTKAAEFANIPKVINTDKFNIQMQHIPGDRLSETLNTYPEKKQFKLLQQIGQQTAKLHENHIIHGDLTTSNTILSSKNNKVYIIDFGLGFISQRIEDKAVDLHLIKQALEAKHFQNHKDLFKQFLKTYKQEYKESSQVLEQLKKVESRGRYKH